MRQVRDNGFTVSVREKSRPDMDPEGHFKAQLEFARGQRNGKHTTSSPVPIDLHERRSILYRLEHFETLPSVADYHGLTERQLLNTFDIRPSDLREILHLPEGTTVSNKTVLATFDASPGQFYRYFGSDKRYR